MELRKTVSYVENWRIEGGVQIEHPVRTAVAAAVITNPWIGTDATEDLVPEIARVAPLLADELVPLIEASLGRGANIEAFGKASMVGLDGEIEHAAALVHTLRFGNPFRQMAEASAFLSSTTTRGPASAHLVIPLTNKNDAGLRSYFMTAELVMPDAPRPGEILVAIAAASSGRPFARIGDRKDELALG